MVLHGRGDEPEPELSMRVGHFIPHQPGLMPDGHATRHEALLAVYPDLLLADQYACLQQQWDVMVMDTHPFGRNNEFKVPVEALHEAGTKLVLLARYRGFPTRTPPIFDETVVPGPYEGSLGRVVDPIVILGPDAEATIPVLVVPSFQHPDLLSLFVDIYPFTRTPARDHIPQAEVVIGYGGTGSLYETLWSGRRYVAVPQSREQAHRASLAEDAGEAIVVSSRLRDVPLAVDSVLQKTPLGRRLTGAEDAMSIILEGVA